MRIHHLTILLLALSLPLQATASDPATTTQRTSKLAKDVEKLRGLTYTGDPQKGWNLFRTKNCMRCHAVWGQGEAVGPDLGRARTLRTVGAGELAGMMWNHIPRMWEKMEEQNIRFTAISAEEMSHMFAFLLFIRYADEPGDPAAGEAALERYQCQACHSLAAEGGTVGPDLEHWAGFVNPVVWAQKMWRHAPEMQREMAARGMKWPEFTGNDLVNIVAYIRSEAAGEDKEYLKPGSPARGKTAFEKRGCTSCHSAGGSGSDLAEHDLPETLAGIASRMWNHAPEMQRAMKATGSDAADLEAQEMADIVAFLMTQRYSRAMGDPTAGRKVFVEKQCVSCHNLGTIGGGVAPVLSPIQGNVTPVVMAHVMWRFGPAMLEEMTKQGIPWPNFEGSEMEDLISFMNEGAAE